VVRAKGRRPVKSVSDRVPDRVSTTPTARGCLLQRGVQRNDHTRVVATEQALGWLPLFSWSRAILGWQRKARAGSIEDDPDALFRIFSVRDGYTSSLLCVFTLFVLTVGQFPEVFGSSGFIVTNTLIARVLLVTTPGPHSLLADRDQQVRLAKSGAWRYRFGDRGGTCDGPAWTDFWWWDQPYCQA
jgi:hypothetical protein